MPHLILCTPTLCPIHWTRFRHKATPRRTIVMLRRMQDRHCTNCSLSHQNALPRSHRTEAMPVVESTLLVRQRAYQAPGIYCVRTYSAQQSHHTCHRSHTRFVAMALATFRHLTAYLLLLSQTNKTCSFAFYPYLRPQKGTQDLGFRLALLWSS